MSKYRVYERRYGDHYMKPMVVTGGGAYTADSFSVLSKSIKGLMLTDSYHIPD